MGVKTQQRTFLDTPDVYGVEASPSSTRPEPIVDVGTDEEQVLKRLRRFAATGDFGYDDSRDWAELFPTVKTLLGALHLMPEVLRGRTPEERERLAELFDAKFEEQFSEHERNLFARVIEPNRGMSTAYGLLLETRRLRAQSEALRQRNEELVKERGTAYRATDEWMKRFEESRKLDGEKLERLVELHHNPDFSPTAKKTISTWRDFEGASSELRSDVLAYIDGDANASYDRMRDRAEEWLLSFEELKRRVKEPNPRREREDGTPAEDPQEDIYDD